MNKRYFKEKVSHLFYTHGLFCSSHPFAIISLVIIIALLSCFPLTRLPFPGNAPLKHFNDIDDYVVPSVGKYPTTRDGKAPLTPRWYQGPPVAYVQQIIVKSVVHPWEPRHRIPADAFRGPLARAFGLVERINRYQVNIDRLETSLPKLCLHVGETLVQRKVSQFFPSYNCLLLSPANFWRQNLEQFSKDSSIMKTVLRSHHLETPPSIRDILFGTPSHTSGFRRFYIRNRQRVVTYAVTVVLKHYNPRFLSSLRASLLEHHPLSPAVNGSGQMVHLHYKNVNYVVEYTPLLVSYFMLFMYIYFSVRKIQMVKSKWGLALSAVMTVMASLGMSIGICAFFGLTPSLRGSEIFPYLVVIIGLENVLVVTKSIVSTSAHDDVKIRVAKGLSKEGWYILKNLTMELMALMFGFFTFVPAIQEFCLFAVVGLLSDFFLQMFFYTTVVSIDLRRMELADLHTQRVQQNMTSSYDQQGGPTVQCPVMKGWGGYHGASHYKLSRSTSVPSLNMDTDDDQDSHTYSQACFVIWVSCIFYTSGLIGHIVELHSTLTDQQSTDSQFPLGSTTTPSFRPSGADTDTLRSLLAHDSAPNWEQLAHAHWSTLFDYYNMSLRGKYISLLPPIRLAVQVEPQEAQRLRHPEEARSAADTEPSEEQREVPEEGPAGTESDEYTILREQAWQQRSQQLLTKLKYMRFRMYPQNQMEVAVSAVLVVVTLILTVYLLTGLYRCMCSRNYPRWRRYWGRVGRRPRAREYRKELGEAVPLHLAGHQHTVECLATDGQLVASACLGGELRVWDSMNGDCVTVIRRNNVVPMAPELLERDDASGRNMDDSDADLFNEFHPPESGASPPLGISPPLGTSPPVPVPPRLSTSVDQLTGGGHAPARRGRGHSRHGSADLSLARRRRADSARRLEELVPSLADQIETNFPRLLEGRTSRVSGSPTDTPLLSARGDVTNRSDHAFDFSGFGVFFEEQQQLMREQKKYMQQMSYGSSPTEDTARVVQDDLALAVDLDTDASLSRRHSLGSSPPLTDGCLEEEGVAPAVWCLACRQNILASGCGNGRVEIWDMTTGALKCIFHEHRAGVTAMVMLNRRLIVARINGTVDFLELETFLNVNSRHHSSAQAVPHFKKGHYRSTSRGGGIYDDIIHCVLHSSSRAHQRPITLLACENGRAVTGSQDHTLKVFRLEDSLALFTLHGHNACITALHLDKGSPMAAASGCEDGAVRLWDLLSGVCIHKLAGHEASVTCLTATPAYVISAGLDDRLCVWERCKGALLHRVDLEPVFIHSLTMLTSNLLISGGQGVLHLWDVTRGSVIRTVFLGERYSTQAYIRLLQVIGNSVAVCEFGNELRVVPFPSVLEKAD